MLLPHNATVVVADGQHLKLFRNGGDDANPKLQALATPDVGSDNKGSGSRHHSSAANPDDSQLEEDGHAAGSATMLNKLVLEGGVSQLIVVAAPRTLGEMRKHYHKAVSAALLGEISKDLTGHSIADIEKALAAA